MSQLYNLLIKVIMYRMRMQEYNIMGNTENMAIALVSMIHYVKSWQSMHKF